MDKKIKDRIFNIIMISIMIGLVIFVYINAIVLDKPIIEHYIICDDGNKLYIKDENSFIPKNCTSRAFYKEDLQLNINFTNGKNNISIDGFKEHRGSYDIVTSIRQYLIDAEIAEDFVKIKKGLRVLITESAPYNLNWENDLKELNTNVSKLYSDKFYDANGKLKRNINIRNEYVKEKTNFINYAMRKKATLLIAFSKALLITGTTKVRTKMSQMVTKKDDKDFYIDMEEAGLM